MRFLGQALWRRGLLILGLGLGLASWASRQAKAQHQRIGAIRIVRLHADGSNPSDRLATMRLGSLGGLQVGFDLLSAEAKPLYYRLRPTTSQGQITEAANIDFFSGFPEQDIIQVEQSLSSPLAYNHYTFDITQEGWGFKRSGRYLIEVFERGDASNSPLISIPLYIYEGLGQIQIKQERTQASSRDPNKGQALSVRLSLPRTLNAQRQEDLRLYILQNGSEDMAQYPLATPSQIRPGEWVYEGLRAAQCWGGNEYKYIEHLSRHAEGYGILGAEETSDGILSLRLTEDSDQRHAPYQYRQDRNGIQALRSLESNDIDTEGVYHLVQFRLRCPRLEDYDLILEGQAFDYIPYTERRLHYDESKGVYQIDYPLKNGYQEYRYALIPRDRHSTQGNPPEPIDGSHYQTQNNYTALLYYQAWGERNERLLNIESQDK